MKFEVGVPSGAIKHYEQWVGEGHLNDFAVAAEQAGLEAVYVTDHPFPEDAWLANGGHHAFDPFVALAGMAAVTKTIKLRTNLLVAGYRNPYLTARSLASLDRLSGGRVVAGMGVGYLKPEFEVLGASWSDRGARFDEAIAAMHAAWTGASVDRPGGLYPAVGHSMLPRPAQPSGPPIWIGGNSRAAIRRAALLADGWLPFAQPEAMSKITGTPALTTLDDLRHGIAAIHELRAEAGRTTPFDVSFGAFERLDPTTDPDGSAFRGRIAEYADAGVTWMGVGCRGRSLAACIDELSWLAENVVGPHRAG